MCAQAATTPSYLGGSILGTHNADGAAPRDCPLERDPGERGQVLVVDDENGPRQALRLLLNEEFDVYLVAEAEKARRLLEERPVDVVITDVRMPKESGIDLLKWIKENQRETEVIILTGYGELETAMKAVEYGAFAYVEKPFDSAVMMKHVREAVESRRKEAARRRLEELALEANRFETFGRFVSGMLHDLGSPLSVIRSLSEFLQHDPGSPETETRLKLLQRQVDHCNDIVRSAMTFLHHRAQQFASLDLNQVVQASLEVAMPVLTRQAVSVTRELAEPLQACKGDFVLARQAVLNLIVNACQAMENLPGQRQLLLRTVEEAGYACLAVEDNGPGVPPEDRSKIFNSFYTTKGPSGTGLGLAAVKNIMQRHQGEVTLRQSTWGGAAFVLKFPVRQR